MGLVILAALALYFLISISVAVGAALYANHRGRSALRWGVAAALVMYLIPFWDWLPTVAMHRHYCSTEAGFWVYKTPEEWLKENLKVTERSASVRDDVNAASLTARVESKSVYKHLRFIPVMIVTENVVDTASGDILAKHVGVGSGYGNLATSSDWKSMKFWLEHGPCDGQEMPSRAKFEAIRLAYKNVREKQ